MSDLLTLQQAFKQFILSDDDNITAHITGTDEEKRQRLKIYASAYQQRCLATLALDFPELMKKIGEIAFKKLVKQYISQREMNHFAIHYLSRDFPAFLQNIDFDYAGLAQFEWLLDEVMDEKDVPVLTVQDLYRIAEHDLGSYVFQFVPAHRLMQRRLIYRINMTAQCDELNHEAYQLYQLASQQKTFAEICEQLCEFLPAETVPNFAITTIQNWTKKQLFFDHSL